MLKTHILFAVFLPFLLFAACKEQVNDQQSIELINAGKVTEIRVKILNTKISGHELFKTISSPTDINNLVSFANENVLTRTELMSNVDKIFSIQDRSTQVDLSFYQSGEYLGNLGLGFFADDKYFIKYRQSGKSKVAVISNEKKKELLDMIGLTEERFNLTKW